MGVARCANGVRSGAAQPTGAGVINYAGKQTANVGEPPTLHFWVFRLPFVYGMRQPGNGLCFVVELGCSFNHASRADGALPFLCFAKEK